MDEILSLDDIAKAGTINPTDVALAGTLTPAQSRSMIKAIVDKSGFLKEITVDTMGKLTKKRSAIDIDAELLTRHSPGETPAADKYKKSKVVGANLDATKGVELNANIGDDTLADNQDNPSFEQDQFDAFNLAFGNDLTRLGFKGTEDLDDVDATFVQLAKGWPKRASDSADSIKLGATGTMIEKLSYVAKNIPEEILDRAVIYLSPKDLQDYQLEIQNSHRNTGVLINGDADKILGVPLKPQAFLTSGQFLATLPKNIVLGLATQMKRTRWYDNDQSVLKYKFVVFPDFEFDIYKFVVLISATELTVTSYTATMAEGASSQRTVQSAGGIGIAGVSVYSEGEAIATTEYNSSTGVITITGVAAGEVNVVVSDGCSSKNIVVTVTAP